ncbi:MAG: thioredoxin domain-containing protein [Deltaproteobacteria bacterium]|nr:thioredoxin domain-containing protein [Deltaproteobacteria bacterium]MBW2414974.1 thioredoxin domain-containing protein [Deltaproteobacteria bacterium]
MPNRLAGETSAYLLQHAGNPVDWYPWGPEAWARARETDRPVLVSIGYSSCHWCHVMEHESFEDESIAALMNERLVSIKVDREERPDVDQVYMDSVVQLQGHGGWPLNVFCMPDGRPFWGGTYFPPQQRGNMPAWPQIVEGICDLWASDRERVHEQAAQILDGIAAEAPRASSLLGGDALHALCASLMHAADATHGGFGAAPKFPTPTNLEAILLAADQGLAVAGARDHVLLTCKRMARGGIFDQLGGGFHRYSTDARWLVPHFEKMLYDQGQLLRVYAETYRQTGDAELRWPVEETLGWLEREMRSPGGGWFASQDADSEGEEGRFYVWNRFEVEGVLGPDEGPAFCDAYGVTAGGTFERTGRSVLEHGMAGERPHLEPQREKLLRARSRRVAPATDAKHVTSWIAYAIGGVATAAAAFGRDDWLARAAEAADFVLRELCDEEGLFRIWDSRGPKIRGFLDDHAAWLCALLDLHRAGADDRYAAAAVEVATAIRARFFEADGRRLFFTPDRDPALPLRPASDSDGATPAAVGLAALGLVRAGTLSGREDLLDVARAALETQGDIVRQAPGALPTLLRAAALLERGPAVAVVVGKAADERTRDLARAARSMVSSEETVLVREPGSAPPEWLDPAWLEGRADVDVPTAWPCRGHVCGLPATSAAELAWPDVAHERGPEERA